MSRDTLSLLKQAFADAGIYCDARTFDDPDVRLEDIPSLDSISRTRLMLSIETTFAITISPEEDSTLETVGDLIAFLKKLS